MADGTETVSHSQLLNTIGQIKELISSRDEIFEAKISAMDRAVELIGKAPTAADIAVANLRALHDEKFAKIENIFVEREKLTNQLNLANTTAIAAALQAQKEAAGKTQESSEASIEKSERSTIENIKQLQALFQTSIAALTTQVNDIKSRLDKGEGIKTGGDDNWKNVGVIIALGFSGLALVVDIAFKFIH